MMLDVRLFGRFKSGPFFALVRKTATDGPRCKSCTSALDQAVPGTLGGSVHVAGGRRRPGRARARGARRDASRSHDRRDPAGLRDSGHPTVTWIPWRRRLDNPRCAGSRAGRIEAIAREVAADVVIERYYNFGGEGVVAAHRLGIPAVLEVNAPIVDYPGSAKARLDRALLVRADAPVARPALPA